MSLVWSAVIVASSALEGSAREKSIRKRYAAAAIPIPIAIFIGVEISLPRLRSQPNSHIISGVSVTTKKGLTLWNISAPLIVVNPRLILITSRLT